MKITQVVVTVKKTVQVTKFEPIVGEVSYTATIEEGESVKDTVRILKAEGFKEVEDIIRRDITHNWVP